MTAAAITANEGADDVLIPPPALRADLDTQLAGPPSADGTSGRHPLPALADLQAAARGWWLLRWAGIASVRILDGALGAWREAGFPLEPGAHQPEPGDVTLSPGHLPVLTADEAAALAADPETVLYDARAGERYRGETEPVDPRAGHIPGAVSAPTAGNLDADGRFGTVDRLRGRFETARGVRDKGVGVYCGSGVTAAHEIAALRLAGIEAALYPGSWSAWSADPARPVAAGENP